MWDGRAARARRAWGRRRVLASVMLALSASAFSVTAATASATSGGAALGNGTRHSPRPAHAAPHRRRATTSRAHPNPLAARGMWIWLLADSNGGDVASIIATAHRYGISTLMIKSGDGSTVLSQFNRPLVSALHANGLRVCAWQYVYGAHPISEAYVGAAAVSDGADCLLIDAESEYETQPDNYVQAQTYIAWLRKLIGANFPVALAGLPYVDYHPAFPYSVFLGPGGAQYNAPQMYWADIGTTVDGVYAHTYAYNEIYRRSIFPLGQVYADPPPPQIFRFRQLSRLYGASGVSWWDWQEAALSGWVALSRPAGSLPGRADPAMASISLHAQGDVVVWAQEHLIGAGYRISVDGGFGPQTLAAVHSFQRAHGLAVDGIVGPLTWNALLRYAPPPIHWVPAGAQIASAARSSLTMPVPKSSRLPAKRDEIAGAGGAGMPRGR